MSEELKPCEWTNCPTRVGNVCCIERLRALSAQPPATPAPCHRKRDDYCKCERNAMLCDGFGPQPPAPSVPPVRERLTVEEIREAIDAAGLDWHNGWTVGEDAENRYLNLARAIERALIGGDAERATGKAST